MIRERPLKNMIYIYIYIELKFYKFKFLFLKKRSTWNIIRKNGVAYILIILKKLKIIFKNRS